MISAPWSTCEGRKMCFLAGNCGVPGHSIDQRGLHTTSEKVDASLLAPTPKNQQELRSFLGLVHAILSEVYSQFFLYIH